MSNIPERIDTRKEKIFHNLNVHNLSGYLGRHMEYKVCNSGKGMVKFAIWQLYSGKNGAERAYYDCVAFGVIAEQIRDQEYKDRGIMVAGNGNQEVWTDNNGKKHSRYTIIVDKFWWITDCKHSDRNVSCQDDSEGRGSRPKQSDGYRSANEPTKNQMTDNDTDDDIPF